MIDVRTLRILYLQTIRKVRRHWGSIQRHALAAAVGLVILFFDVIVPEWWFTLNLDAEGRADTITFLWIGLFFQILYVIFFTGICVVLATGFAENAWDGDDVGKTYIANKKIAAYIAELRKKLGFR